MLHKINYQELFENAKRELIKMGEFDVWDYHYNSHYMTIVNEYNCAIAMIDFNGKFI